VFVLIGLLISLGIGLVIFKIVLSALEYVLTEIRDMLRRLFMWDR
jgi:hypothetical protein